MNTFNEFEENYYPYELNQNVEIIEPFNGVTIQNDKIIEHFTKMKNIKKAAEVTKSGEDFLQKEIFTGVKKMLGESNGTYKINPAEISSLTRRYQKMYKDRVGDIDIPDATVLSKNKSIDNITEILKKQAQKQMNNILNEIKQKIQDELQNNGDKLLKEVEVEVKADVSKAKKVKDINQNFKSNKINAKINTDINKIETETTNLTIWAKSEINTDLDNKLYKDLEGLSKKIGDFKKSKDDLLNPKKLNPGEKIDNFNETSRKLQDNLESLDKDIFKEFAQNKGYKINDIFSDNSKIFSSCSLCKNTDTSKRTEFKEIISKKKKGQDINDFIDNLSADEFKFLISDFKKLDTSDQNYFEQIKYINGLKNDIKNLSGKIVDARPRKVKSNVKKLAKLKLNQLGVLKNNKIDYDKIADKHLNFLKKKFEELNPGENLDDVSPKRFKGFFEFQKKTEIKDIEIDKLNFKNINNFGTKFDKNFENELFEKMFQKKINDKLSKLVQNSDIDSKAVNNFKLLKNQQNINIIPDENLLKEVNLDFNKKIFKELKSGSKNDLKLQKFKKDFDAKIDTQDIEIKKLEAEIKQLEADQIKVTSNLDKSSEFANEISKAKSKLAITKQALNDELSKKQLYESIIDGKKTFDDLDIDALNQFNKYINELDLDELKGNLKNLVGEKKGLSELLNSTADGRKLLKNAEFEADMDFINAKIDKNISDIELDLIFNQKKINFFEWLKKIFSKKPEPDLSEMDKSIKNITDEMDTISKEADVLTKRYKKLNNKKNLTPEEAEEFKNIPTKLGVLETNNTNKLKDLTEKMNLDVDLAKQFNDLIKKNRKLDIPEAEEIENAIRKKITPSKADTEEVDLNVRNPMLAKKKTVMDTAANMKPEKAKSRFKRAGEYLKDGGKKLLTNMMNNPKKTILISVLLGGIVTGTVTLINWSQSTSRPPPPSPESSTPSAEWLCKNRINPITNQNYASCKEEEDTEKTCKSTKNPKLEDDKTYTSCSEMVSEENKCKNTLDPYTGFNYKDCADLEGKEKACKAIKHPNDTRQICPKCPLMYSTKDLKGKSSDNDETTYFGLTQSCECSNTELEDKEVFYSSCQNKKDEEYCMSKVNIIYNKQYLSCKEKNLTRSAYELDPSGDISGIDRTQLPKTTTDAYLRSYRVKLLWGLTQDEVIEEAERLKMEENNPELADVIFDFWLSYQSLEDDQKQIFLAMTVAEQISTLLSSKGIKINEDGVAVDANDDGEMDEFELDDEDEDYSSNIMNQQNYNNINNLNKLNNQQNNIQKKSSKSLLYISIGAGVLFFLLILILILKK